MLHVGPQVVIDRDQGGRGLHPGGRQAQVAEAGGPADGEEHRVGDQVILIGATAVIHPDGAAVTAERLDQGLRVHVHAAGAEGVDQVGRHAGVGRGDQAGAGLEQGDADAEVLENGRHLTAGVGAADDRHPAGQAGQGRDVLVGERELRAGNPEPARVSADGHDDAVGGPGSACRRRTPCAGR